MDFGRVEELRLSSIDFNLAPEPQWNHSVLQTNLRSTKIFLGLDKWGRKEWIGKLYPKGTKDANFLDEYVKHYNSVETLIIN